MAEQPGNKRNSAAGVTILVIIAMVVMVDVVPSSSPVFPILVVLLVLIGAGGALATRRRPNSRSAVRPAARSDQLGRSEHPERSTQVGSHGEGASRPIDPMAAIARYAGEPGHGDAPSGSSESAARVARDARDRLKAEILASIDAGASPVMTSSTGQRVITRHQDATRTRQRASGPASSSAPRVSAPAPPVPARPVARSSASPAPGSEINLTDAVSTMRPGSDINLNDIKAGPVGDDLDLPRAQVHARRPAAARPMGSSATAGFLGSSAATDSLAHPNVVSSLAHPNVVSSLAHPNVVSSLAHPSIMGSALSTSCLFTGTSQSSLNGSPFSG